MALNLQQKKAIVSELSDAVKTAVSAAAADYRGLTVTEMTELRSEARKRGVKTRVYRNTLARRALAETEFACLRDALVGPIVLFLSKDEPGAAARLLVDYTKKFERLEVKALALDGQLLGPAQLQAVASLPSRKEALSQLAAVFLAPVTKFVRTVNEPVAQFARVMGQIRDQKQG